MDENNKNLKNVLYFLAALVVLGALWRVFSYEPARRVPGEASVRADSAGQTASAPQPQANPLVAMKQKELLGEPVAAATQPSMTVEPDFAALPALAPATGKPQPASAYPAARKPGYTPSGEGKRVVSTNFYTPDRGQNTSAALAGGSRPNGGFTGPQVNFQPTTQDALKEERARALAPYLRPSSQEKKRMDEQWSKISAALDRAVAQALMPKSKKEQMIEKYAAKPQAAFAQAGGLTGPYASVVNQINAQKQSIMSSFGESFGRSAAQEAGQIMDAFAGELASAVNDPAASSQEKAQRVKDLGKKYQDKMDKLAEQSQYEQFVAQRVAQDNAQKAALAQHYKDPQLQASINQIIDDVREKDLALATAQLPQEQYYKEKAMNQYKAHKEIADAISKAGQSTSAFYAWENQQVQQVIDQLDQAEKEGKIISRPQSYPEEQKQALSEKLKQEQQDILKPLRQQYGEDNVQDFQRLLNNYQAQMMDLAGQELSPKERQEKNKELATNFNRQLRELHLEKETQRIEQLPWTPEQKQQYLDQLRQEYDAAQ